MRNRTAAAFILMGANCLAAGLSPDAGRTFDRYAAELEARLARQHSSPETYFATLDLEPGKRSSLERRLLSGGIQVEPVNGGIRGIGGALLHHWRGAVFVPNASPQDMLALLRDYDGLPRVYAPEVVSSRALTDDGETARLAVRLREQRVLTVVLDAEYKFQARLTGDDRGYSLSRSTHIWQVDAPGTVHERRRAEGQDDGFLWRLNSYWTFARMRQGLLIECEAVSLTRDVPMGLGWLIAPVIENFPREALEFTLRATKNALTEEHR
jgi:hypothetical protein